MKEVEVAVAYFDLTAWNFLENLVEPHIFLLRITDRQTEI
jgi:hypothetical protein